MGNNEKINGSENVLNGAITMTSFYAQETREPGLIFDGREAIESLESVLDNSVINLQKDTKEEEINEIADLMDIALSQKNIPLFEEKVKTEEQTRTTERANSIIPKRWLDNFTKKKRVNTRSNSTPTTQVKKLRTETENKIEPRTLQ